MGLNAFPIAHSVGGAIGVAATNPVVVSGIKTGDVLLALIRHKPGETPAPVATATFVVGDGAIESDSVNTNGYKLVVIWTHA